MAARAKLGKKVRGLRRKAGLTQAALARRLGISASYLNLIEHDHRPLSAALLIKLAREFELDIQDLDAAGDAQLEADLAEVFGDVLFDDPPPTARDVHEVVAASPDAARAILRLYHAYRGARESIDSMAARVLDRGEVGGGEIRITAPEQVTDLVERAGNHFPELEEMAEAVRHDAGIRERDDLFVALAAYLESHHDVRVEVRNVGMMAGAVRRFEPEPGLLTLSEVLRRGSRNFQLAHQIGLLRASPVLDRLAADPSLATDEARALARVTLANYFAAAVLMPYESFLAAARELRYDIDLLGHRFRASFEQVCHRLTTLHRKGARGVAFHMVRIDMAGNVSKRFGAGGRVRFPRFGGLCPLWNVHAAFMRPGMVRVQLSRLPDGTSFFSVARTVRKHWGGYHQPQVLHAIGLGCDLEEARELVYAEGVDLAHVESAVPVGVTCRLCERADCEARALPPLARPLRVDENVRGLSFYATTDEVR